MNTLNKDRLRPIFKVVLIMLIISAIMISAVIVLNTLGVGKKVKIDVDKATTTQLETPKNGQEIAIIKTNMGDIKVALYREYAPKAVENFVSLAKSGYYDGTYIFENEPTVYFIGGSKNKDGTGGEKNKFDNEITPNLWPFKGSLCSIGDDSRNSSGNKIMFVNSIEFTDKIEEQMRNASKNNKLTDAFINNGGIPNFVGQYTVFAQTYEGMDVFEKISNTSSDEKSKRPSEDIIIQSIEISTYGTN